LKFKNFDQYTKHKSKDINTFINKVAIATNEDLLCPYFNRITEKDILVESSKEFPVIISKDFGNKFNTLNESFNQAYNSNMLSENVDIFNNLKDQDFTPKSVNDIKKIKSIKFPIIASNKNLISEFKTVGKLRSSEKIFNRFTEQIVPRTKFKVLSFRNKPLSIVESINKFPLDVEMNGFKYINEVNSMIKKVHEVYNLDFYNVEILESNNGKIYINSINQNINPNPHQAISVYEEAFKDYYQTSLPSWVKNKMITEHSIPYYNKKKYDSMLIKSSYTMDYSKKGNK
tara:strand:- start:234 stop:1094 length:861 start_codon:yes stop_codon:yes gene_type:complete